MSDASPLLIPSLAPFPAPLITYYPSPLLPLPLAISKVEKTHLKKKRIMDGQTNRWMDPPTDKPMDGCTNGQTDQPMDQQTNQQTIRWTDPHRPG